MVSEKIDKFEFMDVYRELYRSGKTYNQSMLIVSGYIGYVIGKQKSDDENIIRLQNYYSDKSIDEIKKDFGYVLSEWEKEMPPDRRRTDSNTRKLIAKVAKQLKAEGPFIDVATGTSSILAEINHENIYGYDISESMQMISKAVLKLEDNELKNDIFLSDSIKQLSKNEGVFIFDPPMGGLHTKPSTWNQDRVSKIFGSASGKTAPELLFLTSFFLHAAKESYFIGLFPESLVSRINNDTVSMRKFLIHNSLECIVILNTGLVMVIGKGIDWLNIDTFYDSNKEDNIRIIRLKKDFSITSFTGKTFNTLEELLTDLGQENLVHIRRRSELVNSNYVVELPYEIKDRKQLDIQEIRQELNKIINTIHNNYEQLNSDLDSYLVKEQKEDDAGNSNNEGEKKWFEIEPETGKSIISKDVLVLKELYQTNLIVEIEDTLWTIDIINFNEGLGKFDHYNEFITKLKILYDHNRLKKEKNALRIISSKTEPSVEDSATSFNDFINPKSFFSEIIGLLNDTEKRIYQNLCDYWLFGDERKTFLDKENKKESLANIVRTIKLLKAIGLVYSTQNQDKYKQDIIELYQTNRIFHPLLDGGYEL